MESEHNPRKRINQYRCQECKSIITTVDIDKGVTPFMLYCRATTGCKGMMESAFYRPLNTNATPEFEWYKPSMKYAKRKGMADHVDQGGLAIRPITAETLESLDCHICNGTGLATENAGEHEPCWVCQSQPNMQARRALDKSMNECARLRNILKAVPGQIRELGQFPPNDARAVDSIPKLANVMENLINQDLKGGGDG